MQQFLSLIGGTGAGAVVREIVHIPDGLTPGKDIYTPGFAATLVPFVDGVQIGYVRRADGSYAAPSAPAAAVPISVTSAQAKIQCLRSPAVAGGKTLLDDITAAVQAAGGEVAIWFSDARTWERANPYVAQLSGGLKLTSAQVDQLFIAAAQISA